MKNEKLVSIRPQIKEEKINILNFEIASKSQLGPKSIGRLLLRVTPFDASLKHYKLSFYPSI